MTEQLAKPVPEQCPFCGADADEPELHDPRNGRSQRPRWEIRCSQFCVSMFRGSKKEALACWNKRADDSRVRELEANAKIPAITRVDIDIATRSLQARVRELEQALQGFLTSLHGESSMLRIDSSELKVLMVQARIALHVTGKAAKL